MEQLRQPVRLTESGVGVYQLVKVRHWVHAVIKSISCACDIYQSIAYPIYNGAKPENPCSVFLGAFCGLLRENDDLSYAALRPTSIRLSRDAKTATPGAGAEKIGVEQLRPPFFLDNDAIFVRGCQGSAR